MLDLMRRVGKAEVMKRLCCEGRAVSERKDPPAASGLPIQSPSPHIPKSRGRDHAQPARLVEGSILAPSQPLSSDPKVVATGVEQQAGGKAIDGSSEEVPSLDVGQTSYTLTPESRVFLRRRGGEIALVKGEFLNSLKEFEALPLKKQRKTLAKDLLKVRVHPCSVFNDPFNL